MRNILKHSCASLLALLVLCSTFSFTLNEHFCGGEQMSFAIGIPADNCGMEFEQVCLQTTTIHKTPCCDDVSTYFQGQNELQSDNDVNVSYTQLVFKTLAYHYIYVLPAQDQEKAVYKPRIPPPLIKDIQLLDETFLI